MVDTLTTAQPSWADMVVTSKSVSGVQNITRKHHSQRGGVDVRFRRKWRKCKIARAAHRHLVGGTPQALAQVLDPTNPRSASRGGRQIAVEDGEIPARKRYFIHVRGLKKSHAWIPASKPVVFRILHYKHRLKRPGSCSSRLSCAFLIP